MIVMSAVKILWKDVLQIKQRLSHSEDKVWFALLLLESCLLENCTSKQTVHVNLICVKKKTT